MSPDIRCEDSDVLDTSGYAVRMTFRTASTGVINDASSASEMDASLRSRDIRASSCAATPSQTEEGASLRALAQRFSKASESSATGEGTASEVDWRI